MDFVESLKDIKKQMQEQKSSKNKAEKSGVGLKNSELETLAKEKGEIAKVKSEEDELRAIFLKEEKLLDEFSELIKNANIKKI
ncbi:hypothetical protein [Campylobacter helveticus]|uniref:Uncharacterized protein n=1 Tax=Campylobacter helveticus TaxID=28898 RepID=A0AAX2UME0_9BACT|nr:hypothetical protein [Campylobacter helveticus]ARE81007.1 hypothetical protein CHELV3228_1435 [Campylobacter helveticus]MCR2054019.1 hypothetical protein [Campylobacter helveticus]MCR2059299.1 hypothetical protein [Campylobacter helveticus]MCR2065315.1 hypothetical protein [Campylobacter helveticus]TNB57075.1 hypothetical protein FDW47_00480 [Campylobacter helveticus]